MISFIVSPFLSFYFHFLVPFFVLLNKLVSLYEISSKSTVMGFLVFIVEISFSPIGVVSMIFFFRYEKLFTLVEVRDSTWNYWNLRSDAVNMVRSRMLFPDYVRMIDFIINSCLIKQIKGGCVVLLDLLHCSSSKTNLI